MRTALILLIGILPQDQKKDLKAVNEKMEKAKSYRFTLKVTVEKEEKLSLEGEFFAPDALHLRSDKGEFARKGDRKLSKAENEDEWKEPRAKGRRGEVDEANMPHDWAIKMAEQAPIVKREKSDKIGAVTVDIYVYALGADGAKKAAEAGGHPFVASVVDWSKTKNGLLFSVGRDDLYYRVEQRFDSERPGGKSGTIVLEFSDYGRAKCALPDEVKKRLGIE